MQELLALDRWSQGLELEDELAMRVEVVNDRRTNAASENFSVFDVKVVAGMVNGVPAEQFMHDEAKLCLKTSRGNVLVSQDSYSRDVGHRPEAPHVWVKRDSPGIIVANPVGSHSLQSRADRLIDDLLYSRAYTVTLLGTSAVETVVEKLSSDYNETPYARQVLSIIALGANYAKRKV